MTHSPQEQSSESQMSEFATIHPHAASIDIGARSHRVSVPPGRDEPYVREFGCYSPDLHALVGWLKRNGGDGIDGRL